MDNKKYRLLTRADFDGVVTGVLLKELDMISDVEFVHPKDMQDGKVSVSNSDITSNLPFVDGVHLCFDHHASELTRVGEHKNLILDTEAPSAAHVVYKYFGGKEKFPNISNELLDAVNQADAAQYSEEDILAPTGWTQLNFLMDPRTGLDRIKDHNTSHDDFMRDLIVFCQNPSIDEIMDLPGVRERLETYIENHEHAEMQIRRCAKVEKNLVVVDLRNEDILYPCNRFMVYALFPEANISITVQKRATGDKIELAAGKSILDRSSKSNIGEMMLELGGGGHNAAGTCQVSEADADETLAKLVARITADG
ncbi:MAG: exopolyphosphatase [Alphaproteobacteria bacterium]|nr:exopolyphosphatase [Rhodospirillales bacterium]MCW9045261.1 exopolyphosphatase [Alphaproteobacteria bacterium]